MGRQSVVVRLRVDARRPASWLALAAGAAAAWRLSAAPTEDRPALAVLAGVIAAAAAIGGPPAARDAGAWAGLRATWPAAGAALAWLARGGDAAAVGVAATLAASCCGTAVAAAAATAAGFAPADAIGVALALGMTATGSAAAIRAVAPAAAPGWQLVAALCGAVAAAALVAIARRVGGAVRRPHGDGGGAVPHGVMVTALVGMVVCLQLSPHLAWCYAAIAAAWLLGAAVPRSTLGPGAAGEAARRMLIATTPAGDTRSVRAAGRLVAAYAAVLVWPPLVAATLAGSTGAAGRPLAIAVAIVGGAAWLAATGAMALAAGWSRETALAVAMGAALAGLFVGPAGPARGDAAAVRAPD